MNRAHLQFKASNLKQSQTTSKAAENEIVLLFLIARVLVRLHHIASRILNANHGISWAVIWESPWNSL